MMTLLGPWIREKHPNLLQSNAGWQRVEKFQRLGADEVAISQAGALGLTAGALNAIAAQIDAQAIFRGKFGGIAGEEMSVPAPDLKHDGTGFRQNGSELGSELGATLSNMFDEGRSEIHRHLLPGRSRARQL